MAAIVFGELVEAGCLQADDSGIDSITQEHALPDQPAYLACLFDGGTISACNVPCK
jgi:hypothetical protein